MNEILLPENLLLGKKGKSCSGVGRVGKYVPGLCNLTVILKFLKRKSS